MGISICLYLGTGRATCKRCGKRIMKDELQINANGYRESGNVHATCLPWDDYGVELTRKV